MKQVLLILLTGLFAQSSYGQTKLIGRVTSQQGEPLSGVSVFISGPVMKAKLTDARGYYVFLSIPEGTYLVKASKQALRWQNTMTLVGNMLHRKDIRFGSENQETLLAKAAIPEKPKREPAKTVEPAQKTELPKKTVALAPEPPKAQEKEAAETPTLVKEVAEPIQLASAEQEPIVNVTEEIHEVLETAQEQETVMNQVPDQPVDVEGGISSIYKKLVYPEVARRLYIDGKVVVKVSVDANGAITQIDFLKPGHELLNDEVVRVLTDETHFIPAQTGGKCVPGSVVIPIKFSINR
ncbi:TonB family protein [Chloroherpeton thalassium ATCC 35110]|uniref:TonB family protein n=1 Tax=Chloroherpeton thalassium (strain ATCC 35110 / GB-78) TaxID=517418 RepID=B3QX74_CHLT3|nr:TonB family protein [Chloroherpeton thalassium]ACF14884.1 TonB family protein [Chloroherpeton thalassium ATCC 35110]